MAGTATEKDTIRTFICIEIPDSIKSRIDQLQSTLRTVDAQVSWTRSSNIHLTLKFLGQVQASRIPRVCSAVERAAMDIERFTFEIGGAGCFPSPRSPRVLWIGLAEVPAPLMRLYDNLDDELSREGFAPEKRRFSPHLTIGRLRQPKNGPRIADLLITSGFDAETVSARSVIVMRSDLRPTGSIYTPQCVIDLN